MEELNMSFPVYWLDHTWSIESKLSTGYSWVSVNIPIVATDGAVHLLMTDLQQTFSTASPFNHFQVAILTVRQLFFSCEDFYIIKYEMLEWQWAESLAESDVHDVD